MVNDYNNLTVLPLDIKSGKEGYEYKAMPKLLKTEAYRINTGYVLSNDREVTIKNGIVHMPIYYILFI